MSQDDAENTVRRMVETACKKYSETENVVETVYRKLRQTPKVWDRFVESLVKMALMRLADHVRYDMRNKFRRDAAVMDTIVNPPRNTRAGREAASRAAQWSLDYYYVGARRLGDCTRDDLLAAAERDRSSAEGKLRTATFYEQLAAKLKSDTETVRQRFNTPKIQRLWNKLAPAA